MPTPRHDHRDVVRVKPGKRAVDFPNGDKAFPRITENRTAAKTSVDKSGDFGSAHPNTVAYPAAVITDQHSDPGDDTDANRLVTYETLPGPWLPFTRYDPFLGPVQGRRRAVRNTGQAATLTATSKTTYEARGESTIVSIELEETWSNGSGDDGNTAYPILTEDDYNEVRGPVERQTQVVPATGTETGSLALVAAMGIDTVTKIEYQPDPANAALLRKITERWVVPGPSLTTTHYDEASETNFTVTRTLKKLAAITPGNSYVANTSATIVERDPVDAVEGIEVVTVIPQSSHSDVDSGKIEDRMEPYQFPARCDIDTLTAHLPVPVGFSKPVQERTLLTTSTYWVIAADKPDLAFDDIVYGEQIIGPDGFSLQDCIHDDATIIYAVGPSKAFPATTPSWSVFTADPGSGGWIGTPRVIRGSVTPDKHPNRWRVESTSVVMR